MSWEVVIGLETHAQLSTASKIFSGASTAFGAAPNTQASAVDIALPGVLPVLNRGAVERAIRFGLAVGATINRKSVFARKNYFYPDLPKGYQISQYEIPVVQGGVDRDRVADARRDPDRADARASRRRCRQIVARGHWLARSARSRHDRRSTSTAPARRCSRSSPSPTCARPPRPSPTRRRCTRWCAGSASATATCRKEASAATPTSRCAGKATAKLGTRCEIKNLNSFRFLQQAIEFEVRRQIELIEDGGTVVQETRLYDPDRGETRSMRSKEDAQDYRYFPDPDLPPLAIDEAWIERIRADMPELPEAMRDRFVTRIRAAGVRTPLAGHRYRDMAELFRGDVRVAAGVRSSGKIVANWILGEVSAAAQQGGHRDRAGARPRRVSSRGLLKRIEDGTISGKIAKDVFDAMWAGEGDRRRDHRARGLQADFRRRRDREDRRRRACRQRGDRRRVQGRQGQGVQFAGRQGDGRDAGQGQSGAGQRDPQKNAGRLK